MSPLLRLAGQPDYVTADDLGATPGEVLRELCPREPLEGEGRPPIWRAADLNPLADLEPDP